MIPRPMSRLEWLAFLALGLGVEIRGQASRRIALRMRRAADRAARSVSVAAGHVTGCGCDSNNAALCGATVGRPDAWDFDCSCPCHPREPSP